MKTTEARKRLIIGGDVAAARGPFPRSLLRKRVLGSIAAVIALVLIVGLIMRDEIERNILLRQYAWKTGGDATIGALRHEHGRTVLEHVRFTTKDGHALMESDRIAYDVHDGTLNATVDAPRATFAIDAAPSGDISGAQRFLDFLGARALNLHATHGSLRLVRSADPARSLTVDDIAGDVVLAPQSWSLDLSAGLGDATTRYPFVLRSGGAPDSRAVALTADALPLAPIAALFPTHRFVVDGGIARHVELTLGPTPHGTMMLDNVSARVEDRAVTALAGELTVAKEGVGSSLLVGATGGIPVHFSGEVDDVHNWGAIASEGTRDLRALAHMFAQIAAQPRVKWINLDTTAPGVTFGQYAMTSKDPSAKDPAAPPDVPHVVQVLGVDPHEPTLRFDTAIASDHVISKGERTSELGVRTHAIAGVNGDYFDIGRTYEPQGMLIRSGTIVRGPTDRMALVVDRDNKVTFSIFHLKGHARYNGREVPVTQVNSWPVGDATVITPDYGAALRPAIGVTFAALAPLHGDRYKVLAVTPADHEIPVTLGIAFGPKLKVPPPRPGQIVEMRYALDPPVQNVVAGIGGGPLLLRNGEWYEDKHAPAPDERDVQWPVVALGTLADSTLLFVSVDGRHPERSIGMTRPEFADLLKGFGVVDAMALDSGGSVTMVSRAPGSTDVTVRNVPSDNSAERYISDALFIYSSASPGTIVPAPPPGPAPKTASKP